MFCLNQALILLTLLLCIGGAARGQAPSRIVVPRFDDAYCASVKQLEAGQVNIDYRAFRESFIQSEQFVVASKKAEELQKLTKQMYGQMKDKQYEAIIATTQQMLSIDYTSLLAHKILRQTYKIVGDTVNATKYKRIQFGLMNSIVRNGDGKTCATAWPVIQLEEEYFILQILGAELISQGTDRTGGQCDKMAVRTEDGGTKTYYFEVSKVFEGYRKQGIK